MSSTFTPVRPIQKLKRNFSMAVMQAVPTVARNAGVTVSEWYEQHVLGKDSTSNTEVDDAPEIIERGGQDD